MPLGVGSSHDITMNNDTERTNALLTLFEPVIDEIANRIVQRLNLKSKQCFYSREEVCDLLHISKPTLKKLSDKGILSPIKLGDRRVLFDSEQIWELMTQEHRLNIYDIDKDME